MIGFDYVGIGVVITSIGTSAAAIIAAVYGVRTHAVTAETRDAVRMTNGQTIGEAVAESQARDVAHDIERVTKQ